MSEKSIPFEVIEVDLKNKPDWFLKLSPYGLVPAVQDGGEIFYESSIINEYLEESYPEHPMMPATPAERARLRIWVDFGNTRLQPHFMKILQAHPEDLSERIAAFEESLERLETHLEETGMPAPYFYGENFSLVDATFAPSFERFAVLPQLRGYGIPERFERVGQWIDALKARPSVGLTSTPVESLITNYGSRVPEAVRAVAV